KSVGSKSEELRIGRNICNSIATIGDTEVLSQPMNPPASRKVEVAVICLRTNGLTQKKRSLRRAAIVGESGNGFLGRSPTAQYDTAETRELNQFCAVQGCYNA